jgi:hypothetical protein
MLRTLLCDLNEHTILSVQCSTFSDWVQDVALSMCTLYAVGYVC